MNDQADPLELTDADRSQLMGETMRWACWIGAGTEVLAVGFIVSRWWTGSISPDIWGLLLAGPVVGVFAFIQIRAHRLDRVSDALVQRRLAETDRQSSERLKEARDSGERPSYRARLVLRNPAQLALTKAIVVGIIVAAMTWLIMAWLTGGDWLIERILALVLFGHYFYTLAWRFGRQRNAIAAGLCGGLLLGWVFAMV